MPVWFNIKKSKYYSDGSKHVFVPIVISRFLPENFLEVVDPVIERNPFFELLRKFAFEYDCR